MKNIWLITNPSSGSATPAKCEAIEAIFAERGLTLVGRTNFPDDDLPDPAALDSAGVDTAILFAGDGTINAAICALADWNSDLGGAILILPGGTMNLLAKSLHGDADPAAIIAAAHESGNKVALPFVEAGKHRALVGLILGPAATWVRARELVRGGKVRGLARAVRHAWRRTFSRGIALDGVSGLKHRTQAVFVRPAADHLDIAAVDARDFRSIATLGWDWVTGDWVAAAAVTHVRATSFQIADHKPSLALFDGEPITLDADVTICGGMTSKLFLQTVAMQRKQAA